MLAHTPSTQLLNCLRMIDLRENLHSKMLRCVRTTTSSVLAPLESVIIDVLGTLTKPSPGIQLLPIINNELYKISRSVSLKSTHSSKLAKGFVHE